MIALTRAVCNSTTMTVFVIAAIVGAVYLLYRDINTIAQMLGDLRHDMNAMKDGHAAPTGDGSDHDAYHDADADGDGGGDEDEEADAGANVDAISDVAGLPVGIGGGDANLVGSKAMAAVLDALHTGGRQPRDPRHMAVILEDDDDADDATDVPGTPDSGRIPASASVAQ